MTDEFDTAARDLQEAVLAGYSEQLINEFLNPQNVGKIENPDSYAKIKGVCGDTIEMYLSIENGRIKHSTATTDGCGFTIACASYATRMLKGKILREALEIKPDDIEDYFGGLPEENKHCAKLAVLTLRAAVENYQNSPSRLQA